MTTLERMAAAWREEEARYHFGSRPGAWVAFRWKDRHTYDVMREWPMSGPPFPSSRVPREEFAKLRDLACARAAAEAMLPVGAVMANAAMMHLDQRAEGGRCGEMVYEMVDAAIRAILAEGDG
jgi:hypothetical protein